VSQSSLLPPDAGARYAAWLVDLDGTLYRPTLVKLGMAAELLLFGWSSIATLRRFRHMHEELKREPASQSSLTLSPFQLQIQRTAAALGREPAEIERRVREWMFRRPLKWVALAKRPALLTAIAAYRASGGKSALVSDYPASEKLAALGASSLFDLVVSSGEPGGPSRLKPDPEGYLSAATRLGIEPSRCLVIGDRDDADGAAARAAGMAFQIVR
jgi:HAD superfamily hydrolase (TIGR01509 family)